MRARLVSVLLLLLLRTPIRATYGPTVGCTFDFGISECRQGSDDDFDWQVMRTYSWPLTTSDLPSGSFALVNSSQHVRGQRARLLLRALSENDTHCVQFSYFLYSRDGHSPGTLRVYVRVNGGPLGSAVWETSGSLGHQWHHAELAVSTFWPSSYQVVFEATVSRDERGYMALDDILLLNYPCYKVPHFSRLGDLEVNAGQNNSFLCVASGQVSEEEQMLLERYNGGVRKAFAPHRTSHRRLGANFQVQGVEPRRGRDLYRCISTSSQGAAVSNFAELLVKIPPTPAEPPLLLRSGPTYLIIHLNTDSVIGDGPLIRREIEYRASGSSWSELHSVTTDTYKVWHLEPDTEYHISVVLTRPGEGGTGPPGPPLVSRTRCAEPVRAIRGLTATEIQSRQVSLQWEPLGYNVTRCHSYTVSLCYHYMGAGGRNTSVRECLALEPDIWRLTLHDLPPFQPVQVQLTLANPEGRRDGPELTFYTEEDVPGSIAPESLSFTPLDDMIFLKWEEPAEPNGVITQYEVSYQIIESSDPGVNVPGPRHTLSKPHNQTFHVFSGLQPGTTYLVSVRARTSRGFGLTVLTEVTTNISAPAFNYEDMPAPLGQSENTITVLLRPARSRGAPVSTYQVLVDPSTSLDRRVRRDTPRHECFPTPATHGHAQQTGGGAYCAAELTPSSLPGDTAFTVGDNRTYNGYWNAPLDTQQSYSVYLQASSHFRGEMRISCVRIAHKAARKQPTQALEVWEQPEDVGVILGSCAGGLALLVLLLTFIITGLKKGAVLSSNKSSLPYSQRSQMRKQQDSSNKKRKGQSTTESSSLLLASPLRPSSHKSSPSPCPSPYPVGCQLRPAVRVADLLQHIDQMKNAEGYGFRQEYESFFTNWDVKPKKEKSRGQQDTSVGYNHQRVSFHPLLGEPGVDGVSANYIDIRINREGYHGSNHYIATRGPRQDMVYDFWRMVWQENCYSIIMLTRLVEMGRVKCCKYWPDNSETYGDIKITLLKMETRAEYSVRTFSMERRGFAAKQEVCQFQFTAWPEHGVPSHPTGLLAFLRRVKTCTPTDCGPVVVHCSAGAGRTGCYIVLDVMLDMAECEGVVDIYNCVKTLCSRRINMIQSEEQYIFIHEAILEACLCGETAIPVPQFASTYADMLRVEPQSNSCPLREEFQTLNSVTPQPDVEECRIALMPRNREKNRSMDVLPPDRSLALLSPCEEGGGAYINAARASSFLRPAAFVITPHPLPGTTADFWRLVFEYSCTTVVMLNQLHQSNSAWPCPQYWPEPGLHQYGPVQVEFLSRSSDDDVITRLFRLTHLTRAQEDQLVVRHFQFLRWSPYRDVPDSKKAFLGLLGLVQQWQGDGHSGCTVVHCLNGGGRSGIFCTCTMLLEMIRFHNMVDVFYAVKTLRNSKPNMVETQEQYSFCYDLVLDYLGCTQVR